jgi:hypothetical protein
VGLEPRRTGGVGRREAVRPLPIQCRAPRCKEPAAMGARGGCSMPRAVHRDQVRAGGKGCRRGLRRGRRAGRAFAHSGRIARARAIRRTGPVPGGPGRAARKRKNPGDVLFSRKAALSVSSALESLTSVFGMGTGVASPPESPGFRASDRVQPAAAPPHALRTGGAGIFNVARCGRRAPGVPRTLRGADPWSVAEEVKPSTISTA